MTTFIDTNVLIALMNPDEPHHAWATEAFKKCKSDGPAIISDIVYCEFSIAMDSQEVLNETLEAFALERYPTPDAAFFRAGRAYKTYRTRKGTKNNVLPDFIIGAVAELAEAPLLTANHRDYEGYFPRVELIHP